ncbi:MAG TPA: DNA translocase FtsK 4TM domain-containing protein, partial [Thermoleophilaceae bacterium]
MASRRQTKKPARGRSGRSRARGRRSSGFTLPRLPQFDQRDLDLVGLGLVAAGVFFASVFYLGWNGGKVGEALADGFIYLFGGVAYLVPIGLFGAGAVLVLRDLIPSVRPFKAGAACLVLGLMLGLAAGSFGIGPDHPVRQGYLHADFVRNHGGLVGDVMYWTTHTLVQQFGTDLIFLFLMFAGVLLLTGASVAGVVKATSESLTTTT